MQSNDNIGAVDWDKIIECVRHEMWPKLGSTMKAILRANEKETTGCEVNEEDITLVLDTLEDKRIASESITYLKQLIQRAMQLNVKPNQHQYDHESENENDFEALLNDIWSVYKCFHFIQSNFTQYSFDAFTKAIKERAHQFEEFLRAKSTTDIQIKRDQCHLYP
eukprot:143265_1